mmetsp:Transcript_9203/g.17325  ORF Transcript_9203/g.17325 Transcript_9203/m.17325 type:complete len:804 (+) Transcript_9203:48-2459(+)
MWRLKIPYDRNLIANYAFAISAIAFANASSLRRKNDENTDPNNRSTPQRDNLNLNNNILQLRSRLESPLFNRIPPYVKCEAFQETLTHQNKVALLNRRATIRLLEETSHPIQSMHALYKVNWKRPLGEGASGTVYLATSRKNAEQVAVKKIPKRLTDDASFQNEVNALVRVRDNGGHPYICGLRGIFEDEKHYYMVLDLVSGGEMFEHLIKLGAYSEADASRLVKEVAAALTFLHDIGIVHGDLKPENLMLSTDRTEDGTIQIVDFGCAQVSDESGNVVLKPSAGNTPAYCPPEVLENSNRAIAPPMDVWGLGVILYIMLVGLHPFDLNGNAPDEEIERMIKQRKSPPLRNSPITAHLSDSAIDVIEKCVQWDPDNRISAIELLEHPWVRGLTAREDKMTDSSKKLSMYREFKSKLEAKVFADFYSWSDEGNISKKTSLVERAFHSFDSSNKGFLTSKDLRRFTERAEDGPIDKSDNKDDEQSKNLSLSGFSNLLGENMVNRYFPRGHTIYREGDVGNHMYFINSGIIEVTTKDGTRVKRHQGDFFGEGALLHPKKIRSATIHCITPVHAIEISREYFEKYLASSGLTLDLREKDRTRKRNRAKTILRLQKNLKPLKFQRGDFIFKEGDEAQGLFIIEQGQIDVTVDSKRVFSAKAGDIVGEHSLITMRPRNTTTVCSSDECIVHEMKARDFYELYNTSSRMKAALTEVCYRREFQKALVTKTQKEFPDVKDLREVFDAADLDKSGVLNIDEVTVLLRSFDPSMTEDEIKEVITSLDLDESGRISFNEFKIIFGMDEARAASI